MNITLARLLSFAAASSLATDLVVGQSWQQILATSSPSARRGVAMTFDAVRQRTVLFGGYEWGANTYFGDTWQFDGATWQPNAASLRPSSRTSAGLCFDEQRGVSVLFGGTRGGLFAPAVYFDDTWQFDGVSWQQIAVVGPSPSPRLGFVAYDSLRSKLVLFGGVGSQSPYTYGDTWELDGTSWTQRFPGSPPPAHQHYEIAFDRQRGVTVMHPGVLFAAPPPNVTYEWDGVTWTTVTTPTLPPLFADGAMIYDEQRGAVVLVGSSFVGDTETWTYDGADWRLVAGATISGVRTGHGVAYDRLRGATVMFGGEKPSGPWVVSSDETWELATRASYQLFGLGCGVGATAPSLSAVGSGLPQSGTTMTTRVSGLQPSALPLMIVGHSNQVFLGMPLPYELATIGLPGCELLISVDSVDVLSNQGGQADWSLAVPSDPALHGLRFYQQAAALDGNLAWSAVSEAAALTIGL